MIVEAPFVSRHMQSTSGIEGVSGRYLVLVVYLRIVI
jgi:hypothetical protein